MMIDKIPITLAKGGTPRYKGRGLTGKEKAMIGKINEIIDFLRTI